VASVKTSITVHDFLIVLFKHAKLVIPIVLFSTALTAFIMMRTPDLYESEIGVVVNTTSKIRLIGRMQDTGTYSFKEVVNSEVDRLLSSSVLQKAYTKIRPEQSKKFSSSELLTEINALRKDINGVPKRNSSLIRIKFRDEDPVFAADFINNIVDAYLELKVENKPDSKSLYNIKILETRAELDSINQEIVALRLNSEIYNTDKQIGSKLYAIEKSGELLWNLRIELIDLEASIKRISSYNESNVELSLFILPEESIELLAIQQRHEDLVIKERALKEEYSDHAPRLIAAREALRIN
jgi:uncharacterized protein involved in exopolysaccharide biosynthesis